MPFLVLLWSQLLFVWVLLKLLLHCRRSRARTELLGSPGENSAWEALKRVRNRGPCSRWCLSCSSGEWRHIPGACCFHGLGIFFTDGDRTHWEAKQLQSEHTRMVLQLLYQQTLPWLWADGCSLRVLCCVAWSSLGTPPLSPGPSEHLCLAHTLGRAHPFPLGFHPVVWSYCWNLKQYPTTATLKSLSSLTYLPCNKANKSSNYGITGSHFNSWILQFSINITTCIQMV